MPIVYACVPTAGQPTNRRTESPPPAVSPFSRVSGIAPYAEPRRESAE